MVSSSPVEDLNLLAKVAIRSGLELLFHTAKPAQEITYQANEVANHSKARSGLKLDSQANTHAETRLGINLLADQSNTHSETRSGHNLLANEVANHSKARSLLNVLDNQANTHAETRLGINLLADQANTHSETHSGHNLLANKVANHSKARSGLNLLDNQVVKPHAEAIRTGVTNLLAKVANTHIETRSALINLLAIQANTHTKAIRSVCIVMSNQVANSVRRYSTFSHLDSSGRAKMVDVSAKRVSVRTAAAECKLIVSDKLLHLLKDGAMPKGDALAVARVAGVLAAKRTSDLIPLCHQLPLDFVLVSIDLPEDGNSIRITCEVRVTARTGAEMEALTGCSGAALALYDMCKAVDKDMVISELRVVRKTGGKSDYPPPTLPPPPSETPKPVEWPKETFAPINFAYL